MASRWAGALTTEAPNPKLDLADYVGQRRATYAFEIVDIITGYRETINPIYDTVPTLNHNTSGTIKRQVNNLTLGVEDTVKFNSLRSRLEIFMVLEDQRYPLGRYMASNQLRLKSTAGTQSNQSFFDEGFIVDQEITESFGSLTSSEQNASMLTRFLANYPVDFTIEFSPYANTVSWGIGTRGGYIIEQLALDGDWFSPWFDNTNVMRFIRAFDPATAIPTFNLDEGNKVFRSGVIESDDLLSAPNRFVVISNGTSSVGDTSLPAVGVYDIPSSAPHSIANRGFIISKTETRQLRSANQAEAVARNLGQQSTVFETIILDTAPDPRHDSYDVLRWQGSNWLEIAWSLPLVEGANMRHTARKAYND